MKADPPPEFRDSHRPGRSRSEGLKRSLNFSFDHAKKSQRFYGVKTLNLLNSHTDKVLNQTPPDQLAAALAPLLDVDHALAFLALENVFRRRASGVPGPRSA